MVRGVRDMRSRGVRRKWCGTLLLAAVLAVGGTGGCGPGAAPAPGGPPSTASAPPAPPAEATTPGGTPADTSPPGTTPPVTSTPPAPRTDPPATGPTPAPTTPPQTPHPGDVLVEVVVTGGFAGVHNRLVVRYDGTWTSTSGTKPPRTGHMAPAATAELRAALEDPAYARVPARPTGNPIPDGFEYRVTHRHRLVVAGDGERPPALQRVFAALPEGGPPTGR
ncbi:hypothetical protein [Streptomyces sp. NPDC093089]|uniref:hypothetical protein n=1 Tax=Streptomyces sp. NPDC093089 TaxID=3366024 RepID=UPI003814B778